MAGGILGEDADTPIIQFSSPLYFAEEDEGSIEVEVMRLGSVRGRVACCYHTEDASGKAGERYDASEGMLVFEDGEIQQSLTIKILDCPAWCATLEFKIFLKDPEGCILGNYLSTCRIKVIDYTPFPSGSYPEVAEGMEAIVSIGTFSLFWEYVKLNFVSEGIGWRTVCCLLCDQLKNIYLCYKLIAMSYMLNVIFTDIDKNPSYTIDQRAEEATWIGLGYILPMFVLHAWELARARLDIHGHSQCYLQTNLLRKYLNYNEESRQMVGATDVQLAVREDCEDMAHGYMAFLGLLQILGKLTVMLSFTLASNRKALPYAIIMPALMLVFGWLRKGSFYDASEKADALVADLHAFLGDIGKNYNLIADYWERPKINELFSKKASSCREAEVVPRVVKINNDYFPRWLGPLFVGLYIILEAHSILSGELGKGTFVATLHVFSEISSDFAEGYAHVMRVSSLAGGLQGITEMLNLATDLPEWKDVNRKRRLQEKVAREEIVKTDHGNHLFPTDFMHIQVKNVSFWFDKEFWFLENADLSVAQGKLVALLGKHGDGKRSFLKLLAHKVFPKEGEIFIPTHLRILHVSLEPYIMQASIIDNIAFGVDQYDVDVQRIINILTELRAEKVLDELRQSDSDLHEYSSTSDDSENDKLVNTCHLCLNEPNNESKRFSWMDRLSYTEKVKVHLARALVMNPEVMLIQRPFLHFNEEERQLIMNLLRKHIRNRGLGLAELSASMRRPRTVFVSVESEEEANQADIIWRMNRDNDTNRTTISATSGRQPGNGIDLQEQNDSGTIHGNTSASRSAFHRQRVLGATYQ